MAVPRIACDAILEPILQTIALGAVLAAALFGSAGTLAWPMAWGVMAVYVALSVAGFLVMPADLIAERSRLPAGTRAADLVIGGLAFLFLFPISLAVCGLDVRLHASPALPAAARVPALAVFALGYAFSMWAAASNPFFSGVVRVQRERGHRVVASGPYALVRHPG